MHIVGICRRRVCHKYAVIYRMSLGIVQALGGIQAQRWLIRCLREVNANRGEFTRGVIFTDVQKVSACHGDCPCTS